MLSLCRNPSLSEIETIVTTQNELFQADLLPDGPQSAAAKEVALYRDALKLGFQQLPGRAATKLHLPSS